MPNGASASTNHGVLLAALRNCFPLFLRKVFEDLCPGTRFEFSWFLDAIAYELDRILQGDSRRLIVTIPPRHLKSTMISIAWVAWRLGLDPRIRFICVCYNSELAAKFHRDCRQIMESAWYQELFPQTRLRRATEMEIETTAGGGRLATSVGGTLTGLGADIIIIDDPMKADDAFSMAARKQVSEWTRSTLFSRLNDKREGAIILVQQRLHEDDLAGEFLERGGWAHLNLPAIAEEEQSFPLVNGDLHVRKRGDLLHPEREPLDVLYDIRRDLGSNGFAAQYLQAPVPAGGVLIKREWLRPYDIAPKKKVGDWIVHSWDTASKNGPTNDYSACVIALVRNNTVYILHVFWGRLEFPALLRMVEELARLYPPDAILIEDAASGQQLIQMLQNDPLPGVPSPIACKPDSDKITRMSACSPLIEAGELVLPTDAPWLPDFEREVLSFPNGKHDDQADALSQLLTWARNRPKIIKARAWISDEEYPYESWYES